MYIVSYLHVLTLSGHLQEYTSMKCKEKEDEIELRRMRTENSLLRQRIDFLETESSDLADR